MFVVDPKKAIGGHVLSHASTVRVSLRKGKAEQRVAKVVVSPNMREWRWWGGVEVLSARCVRLLHQRLHQAAHPLASTSPIAGAAPAH